MSKRKNQEKSIGKSNFIDYSILVPYLVMAIFGLIMVFSVTVPQQLSAGQNIYKPVISQGVFFIVSLVVMTLIFKLNIRTFQSSTMLGIFFFVEGGLLFATRFLFPPVNGAYGWIPIPGVGTIQPAEFLKVFLIWYLALVLSNRQETKIENGRVVQRGVDQYDARALFPRKKWYRNFYSGWRLWISLLILMVLLMKDLGNATICLLIIAILFSVSGVSYRWSSGYFKIAAVFAVIGSAVIYFTGGDLMPGPLAYINNRFKAWINPFDGLQTYGHQLANSYYAISNGGWFGLGLGNSIEKKGYLTFASTDFIFPVTVEELGVIGGIIILGVLFFLILRILIVGIRARDPFNAFICIGVGSMLLVQTFINVGGAIGIIPETGVTFPFLSQGGSSLLVLSIAVGLAMNSASHERLLALSEENERLMQERVDSKHWSSNFDI